MLPFETGLYKLTKFADTKVNPQNEQLVTAGAHPSPQVQVFQGSYSVYYACCKRTTNKDIHSHVRSIINGDRVDASSPTS